MSKPLTQKITASENKTGNKAKAPVTARYAPIGAKRQTKYLKHK